MLVWALFAQDYDAVDWCVIVCGGALAISCGLWWLSPRVAWYVGASGAAARGHGGGHRRAHLVRSRLGPLDIAGAACRSRSRYEQLPQATGHPRR